jgi:hypothetical protein
MRPFPHGISPSGDGTRVYVGLEPKQPYLLALSRTPDGGATLEPLAAFRTNPAGSAIVNAPGPPSNPGTAVQVQTASETPTAALAN